MTSSTTHGPALRRLAHGLGPQLQLWLIDLDAYAEQQGLEGLSAQEHQRAARMAFAHLARRSLASRHALRRLLGEACGRSPQRLTITTDRFGKPFVGEAPSLHFSLSHREQHALIGLHDAAPLGVDIELARPMADLDGLAEACFSAAERSEWSTLDAGGRLPYFFHCWTRKEACVKALGVGMSAPLPQVDVGGQPPYRQSLRMPQASGTCIALEVHSLALTDGTAGVVAACAWTDERSVALAHATWG